MSPSFLNRLRLPFNAPSASTDRTTHRRELQAANPAEAEPAAVERSTQVSRNKSTPLQTSLLRAMGGQAGGRPTNKLRKKRNDAGQLGSPSAGTAVEQSTQVSRNKSTPLQTSLINTMTRRAGDHRSNKLTKKRPDAAQANASSSGGAKEAPRLTKNDYRDYKQRLEHWANVQSDENAIDQSRRNAAKRIEGWCEMRLKDKRWENPLPLPSFNLHEIPPLPAGVRTVDLSGNRITALSGLGQLPESLVSLNLAGNPLSTMNRRDLASINRSMQVQLGSTQFTPETKRFIQKNAPNLKFETAASERSGSVATVAPIPSSQSPGAFRTVQEALLHWVQSAGDADVAARLDVYERFMRVNNRLADHPVETGRNDAARIASAAPDAEADKQNRILLWREGVNAAGGEASSEIHGPVTDRRTRSTSPERQGRMSKGSEDRPSLPLKTTGSKSESPAVGLPYTTSAEGRTSVSGNIGGASRPKPKPLPIPPGTTIATVKLDVRSESAPMESELQTWIRQGASHGGDRKEAARRIMEWSRESTGPSDDRPLDLSNLDLDDFPPRLPENLMVLQFKNNRLLQAPRLLSSLPQSLMTLNLEGNPIANLSADFLNKNRSNLIIRIDGTLLKEDDKEELALTANQNTGPIYVICNPEQERQKQTLNVWLKSGLPEESPARTAAFRKITAWEVAAQKARQANETVPPLDLSAAQDEVKFSAMPPIPDGVSTLKVCNQGVESISIGHLPQSLGHIDLEGNPLRQIHDRNLPSSYTGLTVRIGETSTLPLTLMRELNYREDNPRYIMHPSPSKDARTRYGEYHEYWRGMMAQYEKYIGEARGEEETARREAVRRLEVWFHKDHGETSETILDFSHLGLTQLPPSWPTDAHIRHIDAKYNSLEDIPSSNLLKGLAAMDLRDNLIRTLPELTDKQKKELSSLVLLLTNNRISEDVNTGSETDRNDGPDYIIDERALQEYMEDVKNYPEAAFFRNDGMRAAHLPK